MRETVVSIFEMDHNWNYIDPRKTVHILKNNFLIFLLSGISNDFICMVRDVLH